jgi:hypothetical protein
LESIRPNDKPEIIFKKVPSSISMEEDFKKNDDDERKLKKLKLDQVLFLRHT